MIMLYGVLALLRRPLLWTWTQAEDSLGEGLTSYAGYTTHFNQQTHTSVDTYQHMAPR